MRNPFFVSRLGAFTLSLLLLLESLEPGYGVDGSWGWYLGLFVLTFITSWDFLSLVAAIVAFLLCVGALDESRAAYIVLTIFTAIPVLRPRGPYGMARLGYRLWSWRTGRGWDGDRRLYIDNS